MIFVYLCKWWNIFKWFPSALIGQDLNLLCPTWRFRRRPHTGMMLNCRHGYHGNCCHASGPPGFLLKQLSASQEYNYICVSLPFSLLLSFSPLNEFSSQINTSDPTQFTDTEILRARMHCDELSEHIHSIRLSQLDVAKKKTSLFTESHWETEITWIIQKNSFTVDLQIWTQISTISVKQCILLLDWTTLSLPQCYFIYNTIYNQHLSF